MFVQGSHTFAMFSAHALHEKAWSRAHMYVATFTQFAQTVIWGVFFDSNMHPQFTSVAHGNASFSMCNTAKLRIMLMEHLAWD